MTNENQPRMITPEERQAWLVEYQTLENNNNSLPSQYWTMTGVFIGFSSALLGGLVYIIMSNNVLLQAILNKDTCQLQSKESLLFGIITCVISIVILLILYFLNGWLKRFSFLQQINFVRMREIEAKLGMLRCSLIHGIDNWTSLTEKEKAYLESHNRGEKWCQEKRNSCAYEPPSRKKHYPCIFYTLISLWALVLLGSIYTIVFSAIKLCQ